MLTFIKTVLAIAVMVMIIPLSVWAGSGNWRHGWQALKEYLRIMGYIVAAGVVLGVIFFLGSISSIS